MRPVYALGLLVIGAAFVAAPLAAFYLFVHGTGAPGWFPKGQQLVWASAGSVILGFALIALSRNSQD